jgi:glycogen phosphorylase
MSDLQVQVQAERLLQKIKHFLITSLGTVIEQASIEEFYTAFSLALREEIMIHWTASLHTFEKKKARTLYYLSMEYLPGRFLSNNIINIGASSLVKTVLAKAGRNLNELIAFEPDPGLGNGGLGRLASCLLDSLATLQYPAFAYGLRYQYGIFEQEIWDGTQVERPDCWLLNENPWEFRRDKQAVNVYFKGSPVTATNIHGDEVYHLEEHEEVRAMPYDIPIIGYPSSAFTVLTLRLWSTKESPRNFELQRYNAGQIDQAGENTSLTDVLYPNDNHETGKRIRLKQEFLLVSSSLQDIINKHIKTFGDLSQFGEKVRIQINDTHPALVIPELVRILTTNHDISWKEAWEITRSCCSYTNHTILKEALEEWNEHRLAHLLPRQYRIIQKLNHEFCAEVANKFPSNPDKLKHLSIIENGQVRMAHLSIVGSHKVNGVSELHSSILKDILFCDFADVFPDKFVNVTNGVTQRRWLLNANPLLAEFITKRIGSSWPAHFTEIEKLRSFANDPQSQQDFLEIKKKNKEALIQFLSKENPVRDAKGKIIAHSHAIGADALFDIQIKRFHEYKRQLMNLLHVIMIYHELKEDPNSRKIKRMVIMGGKAAPGYENAKKIIHLAYVLMKKINSDPAVNQKLAFNFVENYNVSKAQILIPAADLSEQISTAGMEASGTGNMKFAMNGALTIGTEDGANIEMRKGVTDAWWPFSFGALAEDLAKIRKDHSYKPFEIYSANPKIRKAVDALKDGSLAFNDADAHSLHGLYSLLLEGFYGDSPDRFFVLQDLEVYYQMQKKVEELYANPARWAEYAIHNIAGMGKFSTDESIRNYANLIWNLEKCPIDPEIFKKVEDEYMEHDRCRINL